MRTCWPSPSRFLFCSTRLILLAVFFPLVIGCGERNGAGPSPESVSGSREPPALVAPASAPYFRDVAHQCGISWVQQNGEDAGHFAMLESFGAGCALDDFDQDGLVDLFLAGGGRFRGETALPVPIALYRQMSPWIFRPVTEQSKLTPIRHYHHGMWTADFNEDGYPDLLVTGWDGLQLFQNQGDGTFVDLSDRSGLDDTLWSLAAAWVDLNGDQLLDLFVGHYVDWSFANNPSCFDSRSKLRTICDPPTFSSLPHAVFLSNGDGTFRQGGLEVGIHGVGKTLGVVTADLNGDRRPEVYVANDTVANQLYESQPDGTYREVAIENGVALGETGAADGSMGVDVGDIDNDGLLDLWVANYENQTFAFYRNLNNGIFTHASKVFGVTQVGAESVGFGTVLFDADSDGHLDVFCANGHIWPPNSLKDRRQVPYLFWNDSGRRLRNVAPFAGDYFTSRHLGRGAASADLDRDGDPDLVVTHTGEPVAVLRNESNGKNWLSVRLIGRESPRSAIGATVKVVAGGQEKIGVIRGGGSYLSTSERNLLFGLGATAVVDSVTVDWPAGGRTTLKNVSIKSHVQITESQE